MAIHLKAPAKINWFLHVGELRSDGYHEINTLMQKLNLYDEIYIDTSEDIVVECDIPIEDNLCLRAYLRLKEITGCSSGAIIRIKKNIPIGAGLGGGSSDAAIVLEGLNELLRLKLSQEELIQIAKTLGSDIPFFLNGPSAIVKGRGEIIEKVNLRKSHVLLLVKPEFSISSRWAYKELDRMRQKLKLRGDIRSNTSCQDSESPEERLPQYFLNDIINYDLRNDLEEPVFRLYPVLKEIKQRLLQRGAIYAAMTGSGSTIFGVFKDEEDALKASYHFNGFWCRIAKTILSSQELLIREPLSG